MLNIRRLHISDWRVIAHYLGVLVLICALVMLIPFIMALVLHEFDVAVNFLFSLGITFTAGTLLLMCKIKKENLTWYQALVIAVLCWVALSGFGALPLWLSDNYVSYLDAYFEAVSCFTTTGLSVVTDQNHMAYSLIMWRCLMSLLGGIGVVVVALALGVFGTGAAAASLYHAEARGDRVMPEIKQSSRFIAKVSLAIVFAGTLVCTLLCLLMGFSPLQALCHGFFITVSDYSTGGTTASSMSIAAYHSWPLEIATVLIMFFSGINFVLYGDIWRAKLKPFFKDIEIHTIVLWITILVCLAALALRFNSYFADITTVFRRGIYPVLSAACNIGFTNVYSGQLFYVLGTGMIFVIILGMAVGTSASSISGGIKALRLGIIVKSIFQSTRQALAPDTAKIRSFYFHQGKRLLTPHLASSALTIALMYVFTFAIGAAAGILCGNSALSSIFESVSAAANAGLSCGITSASMPLSLKLVYIFEMWLGRLEFIVFFAILLQCLITLYPKRLQEYFNLRSSKKRQHSRRQAACVAAFSRKVSFVARLSRRKLWHKTHRKSPCALWRTPPRALSLAQAHKSSRLSSSTAHLGAVFSLVLIGALVIFSTFVIRPAIAADTEEMESETEIQNEAYEGVENLTDRYAALEDLSASSDSDTEIVINTNITMLTDLNQALNEQLVAFDGEVVGNIVRDGPEHSWINVSNSSGSAIGVYVTNEQIEAIEGTGDYHSTGAQLSIEGIYHVACDEHQGELEIHATQLTLIDSGGETTHYVDFSRFIWGVAGCVFAFIVLIVFIFLRRRSEQLQ